MKYFISFCCAAVNGAFLGKTVSVGDEKSSSQDQALKECILRADANSLLWSAVHSRKVLQGSSMVIEVA